MIMKHINLNDYLAPEVEVVETVVEQGFAGSLESPEPDGEL